MRDGSEAPHAVPAERAAGDVAGEGVEHDPLHGDARLPGVFGPAWPQVTEFHRLLVEQGVLRGLVGPREVGRLWERHLLNSAAVVPFLRTDGSILDLGSGAGLPGVVIAAMRPEQEIVLLEPMERRTTWLVEVVEHLGLSNTVVVRGRAQDVDVQAGTVTSRAVAALDKLYRWAAPLVAPRGELVVLKGHRAADEVAEARRTAREVGIVDAEVLEAPVLDGLEATRVVRARRGGGRR